MLRTIWFALFCLAVLGAMIAIKVAIPAPRAVVETHEQSAMGGTFELNTAAKSDRLPLIDVGKPADFDSVAPVAPTISAEAPSSDLDITDKTIDTPTRKTIDTTPKKIARRRWQDANAKLIDEPPPRRHKKARPEKTNAENDHGKRTGNVFRCRQDAFGGLLRSLDLSPRCHS
jgi:hypothetical protein